MPNHLLFTLLLSIANAGMGLLHAQEKIVYQPNPGVTPRSHAVVLSGIGFEGSSGIFQTFFVSAEQPISAFQHLGLHYTAYLSEKNNGYYYANLLRGSYEIGLFSKFFLHRRADGRPSRLYYGPQLRFGVRKMAYDNTYFGNSLSAGFEVKTTKVLFCIGGQYRFDRAVLAWSLPLGGEFARTNLPAGLDPYGYYTKRTGIHLTVLPSVGLGFRL